MKNNKTQSDDFLMIDLNNGIIHLLSLSSAKRRHHCNLVAVSKSHQLVVNVHVLLTHGEDRLTLQGRESARTRTRAHTHTEQVTASLLHVPIREN